MNELQELRIEKMPLREFIRGQTLDFIMYLSKNIPPNYFMNWIPTAQLRKLHNPTKEGFIADLDVTWADLEYTALRIRYLGDTSKWPLGPVEFDVVLTPSPSSSYKVRTFPVRFTIVPEVTRYDKNEAPCEGAKEIELIVEDGFIRWRRKGEIWQDLIPLAELKGADGRDGEPGKGWIPWDQEGPPPAFHGRPGEFILTPEGRVYYVNPDGSPVFYADLKGKDGKDGKDIEFDVDDDDYFKWRREGEEWQNLISLKELVERHGKEIILTASPTHILWKYITDETWKELVPLEELKGEKGEKGDKGDKGDPGEDGTKWYLVPAPPPPDLPIKIGDLFLNTETGDYYEKTDASTWTLRGSLKGPKGEKGEDGHSPVLTWVGDQISIDGVLGPHLTGPKGDKGDPGEDGTKWYVGASIPSDSLGKVGDFYLVSTTGDYYEKIEPSKWALRGNLKGPKGDQGDPGEGVNSSGIVGIATYRWNYNAEEYELVESSGNVQFPIKVKQLESTYALDFDEWPEYPTHFVFEVKSALFETWLVQKFTEYWGYVTFAFIPYSTYMDPLEMPERPETFRVIMFRVPD